MNNITSMCGITKTRIIKYHEIQNLPYGTWFEFEEDFYIKTTKQTYVNLRTGDPKNETDFVYAGETLVEPITFELDYFSWMSNA